MHIGFGAQQEFLSILIKDSPTLDYASKFRLEAREVLTVPLEKIFDSSSISFTILKHASLLDPKVVLPQPLDVCKEMMQRLLFNIALLKINVLHKLVNLSLNFLVSTPQV